MAGFHSAIHRLCKLPLSVANFKKEYDYIKQVAKINGYDCSLVDRLVYKHSEKVRKSNLSSFFTQNDENIELKRVAN